METNVARAAQLATNASYYENKAAEAWDLVSQLSTWGPDDRFIVTFTKEGASPGQLFPINFNFTARDIIGLRLLTELFLHFQKLAMETISLLEHERRVGDQLNSLRG